jgi:hypothetical protein
MRTIFKFPFLSISSENLSKKNNISFSLTEQIGNKQVNATICRNTGNNEKSFFSNSTIGEKLGKFRSENEGNYFFLSSSRFEKENI